METHAIVLIAKLLVQVPLIRTAKVRTAYAALLE
jgi:hypothetical protein